MGNLTGLSLNHDINFRRVGANPPARADCAQNNPSKAHWHETVWRPFRPLRELGKEGMVCLSVEGDLHTIELREGKAHSQRGTANFLRESIRLARQVTDAPILVHLDAGNDALDNITVCIDLKGRLAYQMQSTP